MRNKIILIIIVAIIITTIIYAVYKNDKKTYLALGDIIAQGITPNDEKNYGYNDYVTTYMNKKKNLNKYYKEFTGTDLRTNDLINMIKNNEQINENNLTIQQALVKSNYVTLSIGSYDLYNHLGITTGAEPIRNNYELNKYFLSMFSDLDDLLKLIRKYTPGKIVVVGFYNPVINPDEGLVEIFDYIDKTYKTIATKNKCEYISLKNINSNQDYLPNPNSILINMKGHQIISEKIIEALKL